MNRINLSSSIYHPVSSLQKRRAVIAAAAILLALTLTAVTIYAFSQDLTVSHYDILTDKTEGRVSLALVSDLHSCDYGEGQSELLAALDAERPDAVLLCGDIFDDRLPPDATAAFIGDAAAKYPCFYVSGNHEFWSGDADGYKQLLESLGVKVLEGTSAILDTPGGKISIAGVDDPDTDRYPSRSGTYAGQLRRLAAPAEAMFSVILSHRPERADDFLRLKPDLVLSGHAHGGQWRLPLILKNGLLAPNQGFFPKYTSGGYRLGDTELVVSRGLARESTAIPRIFNRPEIVFVLLNSM